MALDTDQTLTTPTVLLLGASSQIGVFAIPQLILAGFRVLAVSRRGKPEAYPDFGQVAWLNESEALEAAQHCELLLSTGPLKLAKKFMIPATADEAPATAGPETVTPGPETVTPGPETATPGPETVTPVPETVTPGPEIIPPGPEIIPPGPEIIPPGPETVTPGSTRGPFKTALIFSSSSVASKQKSNSRAERSQVEDMLSLEADIQKVAQDSGLKLVILRPTLVYGCGLDRNISRLASWIRDHGYMPVNGKAAGLRQPVHAEDLASVAINALLSDKTLPGVLFLGGGETLSYSDMVEKIFAALDMPSKLVRLPEWVFVLLIHIAGRSKFGEGINIEMVKRQGHDLMFDDQQARQLLYHNPRPFAPVEADFSLPDF